MILCITPDHEVRRCADDTPGEQLQEMYAAECVILRINATGYGAVEAESQAARDSSIQVEEWIGGTGSVPPVGWTRVESIE